MKKVLKTVLMVILSLLLSTSLITVSADLPPFDTFAPYFQIESKSVNMGDEVELSVSIGNNPGFWSAKLTITYDDGLSFVKENSVPILNVSESFSSKASVDTSYSMSKLNVLLTANEVSDISENGVVFTFKIKVDNDAVTGDYNVSFTDYSSINFINADGEKVGFTFGNGVISVNGKSTGVYTATDPYDYSFDAVNCNPVASTDSTLGTYSQSDISPKMTLSKFIPTAAEQYVEYTLADLPEGKYDLYIYSRDSTARGTFDIYVDDVLLNTVNFYEATLVMNTRNVGSFTLLETKNVTVRFVADETVNGMYLASFRLYKDKPVYEQKTVSIYTMDELSRPSVYGVTRDYPNTVDFVSVSDNNVLSYEKTTDGIGLISRSLYFKLPDDIFTKYYNLLSLSISIKTDTGKFYSHNNGYNRMFMSSYPTENPTSKNAVKIASSSTYTFSTTATAITIDLTSSVGENIVKNDYKYFNLINSVDNNNGNTYKYLYIDDVTLTYNQVMNGNYVTIDDESTFVPEGAAFTFPNNDDDIVAYKDLSGNYYACGSSISVTEDTTFESVKLTLKTLNSASMRLGNMSGIRFYTALDTSVVQELRDSGISVNLGTLIAPEKYFGTKSLNDLKHGVDFGKTVNYADVVYSSLNYYKEESFSGIVGSIVNIKDDHVVWNYVGRGYAQVVVNGITKYIYAQSDTKLPSKSIGYISFMLKKDSSSFNALSEINQSIVNRYYDLYCNYYELNDPYKSDKF